MIRILKTGRGVESSDVAAPAASQQRVELVGFEELVAATDSVVEAMEAVRASHSDTDSAGPGSSRSSGGSAVASSRTR
jgi:hypothetical protein